MTSNKPAHDYAGQEFTITREFAAPRELVFQAWTDPQHLAQWWGPRGFTNPVCDWHAAPGKIIHVVMRAPNGTDYPMGGEFREVVAPERLVFTTGALDEKGSLLFELLHTATFEERDGKTAFKLHSRVIKTTADAGKYIGGFEAGMTQSLEKLTEHLAPKSGPLVVERTYDAPAALVWKALTTAEDIREWSFEVDGFEPRVGFEFKFDAEKEDITYRHRCKVTTVIPGRKLAYTWRYEDHEGESLVTFELFEDGRQTRVKLTHEGLETFPQNGDFARSNFTKGWAKIVGSLLKEFVETQAA